MDFDTELQALIKRHHTPEMAPAMASTMARYGAAMNNIDPYGSPSGHNYNVFPGEDDPNYGDPFGGPSEDTGDGT